jgi:hypothetical protein
MNKLRIRLGPITTLFRNRTFKDKKAYGGKYSCRKTKGRRKSV